MFYIFTGEISLKITLKHARILSLIRTSLETAMITENVHRYFIVIDYITLCYWNKITFIFLIKYCAYEVTVESSEKTSYTEKKKVRPVSQV